MALTLLEAAKLETGNVLRQTIIELYAGSAELLQVLPFENIEGNSLSYNREASLPGIAFRGVNEGYTPSTGILNPITERLVIAGGDLDVDRFIIRTQGLRQRAIHEEMKIRSLALGWVRKFIKGDQSSDSREFDGLQTRVTGNQVISAGSTANGAALSLSKLDEAIDQTLNPTHLLMSKAMARKFSAAARTQNVSGNINWEVNQLGNRVLQYNGLPIITVDLDNTETSILGFNEAAASGTATATSIYVMSLGPMGLTGIQNGGIEVRDLGELEDKPVLRTRIEWYNGLAIFHGRAVTRLQHIGDLAITA